MIASFPFPVGTGMWIAGGNNHTVRNNRIWDNWRRGTMLFAVPDSLICGPAADGNEQAGCDSGSFSTSYDNRYYGNVMGTAPDGAPAPNGTDFWWDNFPEQHRQLLVLQHRLGADHDVPRPASGLRRRRESRREHGHRHQPGERGRARDVAWWPSKPDEFDPESSPCPWFNTPPKPGSAAASAAAQAEERARMRQTFLDFCEDSSAPLCEHSGSR